jgi:hypothetical protein
LQAERRREAGDFDNISLKVADIRVHFSRWPVVGYEIDIFTSGREFSFELHEK